MKNKPIFRVLVGMLTSSIAGLILENIPAGLCLGTAVGLLTMILSFTRVEQNNRN